MALYGLKQTPRAWYEKQKKTFLDWKLSKSKANSSLFFYMNQKQVIFALVYVDDIMITSNDQKVLQDFVDNLNAQFAPKDMGELHQFLGIEVRRGESSVHLTQIKYTNDMLKMFNFEHLKPCATPMK